MKKFLIILLIALVTCNFEEENPDILNDSPEKEEELEKKQNKWLKKLLKK